MTRSGSSCPADTPTTTTRRARDEIRAAAVDYLRAGYSVLPLAPACERPAHRWAIWTGRRMPEGDAVGHFGPLPARGVGIVTGAISGGLVVLDVEAPYVGAVLARYGALVTPTVRTQSGGIHLYTVDPDGAIPSGGLVVDGQPVGDILAEGRYAVAPPTTLPTGRYSWLPGRGLGDVPIAPVPAWVAVEREAYLARRLGVRASDLDTVAERDASGELDAVAERDASARRWGPIGRLPAASWHPSPSELIERLPANLIRVVEHGWRIRGAFASRSEADWVVLIALAHLGASIDAVRGVYRDHAIGAKYRERSRPDRYLVAQYALARLAAADDIDGALPVRCDRVFVSDGRVTGGARRRATLWLRGVRDGRRYDYTMPVVLGPPRDGLLSGEWIDVATAFGVTPIAMPTTVPTETIVGAVIIRGRVRRLVVRDSVSTTSIVTTKGLL